MTVSGQPEGEKPLRCATFHYPASARVDRAPTPNRRLPFIVGEQSGDAHLATYVQLPVVGLRLCPWSLLRAVFRLARAALLRFFLSLSVSLRPTLCACVRAWVWVCVNVWICVWLCKLLTLCVFMPATTTSDSQFSKTLILLFMKENPFTIFVLINLHTHHQKINNCGEKIDEGNIPFEENLTWRLFIWQNLLWRKLQLFWSILHSSSNQTVVMSQRAMIALISPSELAPVPAWNSKTEPERTNSFLQRYQ